MNTSSKVRKIAFVGDHLPRKCGIATFTSDLLAAVQGAYPQSRCLAVSVNDIPGGYEYPEVVRFEIEEQDLSSYLRAADFLNISKRGHRLPAARVRHFRRAGRRPRPGAPARTEDARRHHAAHHFGASQPRTSGG